MGILNTIKGWVSMLLKSKTKEEFHITPITSPEVEWLIEYCARAYRGQPDWEDPEQNVKTVNFAEIICSETARLATMGIGIHTEGGARAEWLQKQIDKIYPQLREWTEYAMAYGTILLKPNGDTVKVYVPGQFEVTSCTAGVIDGAVFHNYASDEVAGKFYERLEYHRFEDSVYVITNKCFVGSSAGSCNQPIDIALTPWAGYLEEARILNVDKPLFAAMRTPQANNLEVDGQLALPIFSGALEELRDLDVAYSRNAEEIEDSKRTVLLDSDRLLPGNMPGNLNRQNLPKYVKLVDGDTSVESNVYHEINPTLNTETRITGINALLSQIGFKCGFSNGHFVFNQKTGMMTAREVESNDARTIQTTKDIRDKLEACLDGLLYAMSKIADLYHLAPIGSYKVAYDFGDITYNRDEDRARWWSYVQAGKVAAWRFFVKFKGMTEADAKEMTAEAQPKTTSLFE